ncbi:hypothetical protein AC623_04060 [Bacillus sp. FJAT-27231]|uniref:sensor histidine kinase n=1 Tax=Bacillus sp. FJAT-27231 TaxID=1679168 RepID=UPI000671436C|nr:sensor histidine kinase [Bacillus sp. FJAT-27231]KMY53264.1 hypothetical protein AC623_04060 [Bacillus sp. FJAT-27231]
MIKRSWSWLDTFLFCVRTLWVIFNCNAFLELFTDDSKQLFIFIWFIGVYIIPYIFYRPGYINSYYYLLAETLLTGGLYLFMMSQFHLPAINGFMCFPLITIAYMCQARPLLWIGPLITASIFTVGILFTGKGFAEGSLTFVLTLAIFYGLGFSLGRVTFINHTRKELMEAIQEKSASLEQYSKRIEELTIIAERNRVSENLHNTVNRIFTSMVTDLESLPFLLDAHKDSEAEEKMKEISTLTRQGLHDVRKTIHQLSPKEEIKTLSAAFEEIIEEFKKHTDTDVHLEIKGIEREVGERIKLTLIRCLQESLTHAKRNSHAVRVNIDLSFTPTHLTMQIKDNGIGRSMIAPDFGPHTMKERVDLLRGTLHIESNEGEGTSVVCLIPIGREEEISL